MNILEEVKKFVEKEFEKPEALYKESFENHFVLVVRYAKEMAKKEKADEEIVEIAAWLHDIGSIQGNRENHHIVSAKVAEELLTRLNYPREKVKKVKECILAHRGSVPVEKKTKESQILADADVMAHFDDIAGLLTRVYKNKKDVLDKLERGYAKLSDSSKILVKDKLEKARKELK